MSMSATIACPECGHGGSHGEANAVIGFYEDPETGFLLGHRMHCNKCEHLWDDWLPSARRNT